MRRFVIAGGGTGGHISPAISVAEAITGSAPDASVDFICTPRPVDRRMYAGFGERVHVLDPPRLDRGGLPGRLAFPFRALGAFRRARRLLRVLQPELVFATGGYSSFFAIAAARTMGTPTVLHDSNSIPGRANRLAARFADRVMVGFSSAARFFPGKAVCTGNPIRACLRRIPREEARAALGIAGGPVVLFLGGSQGARAINDLALECAGGGVSILLQSGERDSDRIRGLSEGRDGISVFPFVDDPSPLYSAADLCVARSGAMTIAELCWFRLPAVFVPYPHAADDHQTANAAEITAVGGAIAFPERDAVDGAVREAVGSLTASPERLEAMSASLAEYMPGNPAGLIAGILLGRQEGGAPDAA